MRCVVVPSVCLVVLSAIFLGRTPTSISPFLGAAPTLICHLVVWVGLIFLSKFSWIYVECRATSHMRDFLSVCLCVKNVSHVCVLSPKLFCPPLEQDDNFLKSWCVLQFIFI